MLTCVDGFSLPGGEFIHWLAAAPGRTRLRAGRHGGDLAGDAVGPATAPTRLNSNGKTHCGLSDRFLEPQGKEESHVRTPNS